ncbi:MAG: hypothetical protein U0L67_05995 [Paludibacteraceae bacterium]|nr:hypothetical protein [Paludibacteraceae bacterium]MEE0937391.1 hypothetical protein [Bacteroidales bacterium]
MMKKILAIFCILIPMFAYAESEQGKYTEISIRLSNGKQNPDGTTTYKNIVTRVTGNKLFISCSEPGDKVCPATVTTLVTIVAPVADRDVEKEVVSAIDVIKKEIVNGKTNSRFSINKSIYEFNQGVLLDNGSFEFSMTGILDQSIIK